MDSRGTNTLLFIAAAGAVAASAVYLFTKKHRSEEIKGSFSEVIGNTPMVELKTLSKLTGCRILVKLENLSAGGSVKDRAAKAIILDAEKRGIKDLIEATAGNTGIAMALMCRSRNMNLTVCIPEQTSKEKQQLLRTLCHEVVVCKNVSRDDPQHFQSVAKRLSEERGLFYTNQFDNEQNYQAHLETTGPEIWDQTKGDVDVVCFASGTGGTIAGVSNFLADKGVDAYLVNGQGAGISSFLFRCSDFAKGDAPQEWCLMRLQRRFV